MFGGDQKMKCAFCGYEGRAQKMTKGSFILEVVLWFFFIIPGFIYSIWRLMNKVKVCPVCHHESLIPIK